ncbi:MAG TPA: efflux RND transporter periplasmic adaptor subunit [Terriglobales bacterium]|nr:efflux RND transporter periplasmic adaptor subunit [Terriglobales bacterium]
MKVIKPFVVAMTLMLLAIVGCSKEKPEEPEVAVQVVPVQQTTLQRDVAADAILFPLQQAAIVPKISAPVQKFYVKRGSRVHQGELLATLENKDLTAAAQDTKGAYDQAQAAYETTTGASLPEEIQKAKLDAQVNKEAYDAEQKVYNSRKELYAQGALPRKDFEQAGVNLAQARSQYEISQQHLNALLAIGKQQELKAAAGQLESAKGKYLGATAQLSYSKIYSPIEGWVTDRSLYPGEMAAAGTPLITVMDLSQVIARAHIPQEQAALLKVGDKASIRSADVDAPVDGKVTVVSPALDPNSTTVEVWVQAKNPDRQMKPGSSVHLIITSGTVPAALVVPAVAVQTNPDGGKYVMLAGADCKAHQAAVKVGISQDQNVQITEGLKSGDKVITAGAYGLPDNTKIKIEAPQEPEKEGANSPAKSEKKDENDK